MLGWKVNVGYANSILDIFAYKTMDQFTFLDNNKYWLIAEVGDLHLVSKSTTDAVYQGLRDTLGDFLDSWYCLPAWTDSLSENQVNQSLPYIPSAKLAYPNTWEYAKGKTTFRSVMYIPNLNRLVVAYGGFSAIYSVNGNSLTYLGNSRGFAADAYVTCVGVYNYSAGVDLTSLNYITIRAWFVYASGAAADSYSEVNTTIKYLFTNTSVPDITITPGPYEPGGESGEGDLPPGTFDDSSDPIPDSSLPTLSASDTGFTRIYNPTLSQVQALARYLWTEPSVIETIWNHIKQFFEDPMEAIIGFNLVPCRVPDGGTREFALMFIGTGVQMTAAANQFVDVDCGTYTLERYYGSALDQNPYTKVSCFLPYIGTVHLNTDEVMGTTLQVKYRIDIVSGSCVAKILVDGSVLYQYSGHCAISIPISAADFSSYVSAAIGVGTALAGMAVGAAAGGAAAVGSDVVQSTGLAVASESTALAATESSVPSVIGPHEFAAQQLAYMSANPPPSAGTQASFAGLNPESIVNTVGQVMGGKMQVEHSGAFSGNSGYLGVRRPFLIIERPNMCLPATYGQLNGYPSMITMNLGECEGFTRVQQVQLTGCTATNPEQSEILQFLKSGVIL